MPGDISQSGVPASNYPSPSLSPGYRGEGPETLAIDLHDVRKVYRGRIHALEGIEMQVRRGEVFGLLGPNGAGKSTLVKIMMSVVRPTRARGTILGQPVAHKATLRRIGYLPENHRFPRYLTGRQTLDFFGAMAKVGRATRRRRAAELLDVVGMTAAADRKIATYSKGMAQRIGLAQALMNDPELVVLDEPTDGVDPEGRRDIRAVLNKLRREGKTVFVNSHLLSELEMVSDRVAILVGGRVAKQGTIDELTIAKQRYEIEFVADSAPADAVQKALAELFPGQVSQLSPFTPSVPPVGNGPPPLPYASSLPPVAAAPVPLARPMIARGKLPGGQWIELEWNILRVGTTAPADVQPLIDTLRAAGVSVRRVQMIRPSLEELFIDVLAAGPAHASREETAGKPAR